MKTVILYFSATGNTAFISDILKEKLKEKGIEAEKKIYERFDPENVNLYDVLILAYPIYACSAPDFFNKYIEKIQTPKLKKAAIISTMGFFAGSANAKCAKKLKRLGIKTVFETSISMPGSDGLSFLKKESKVVKSVLEKDFKNNEKINRACEEAVNALIYENKKSKIKTNPISALLGVLFRCTYKPLENILKTRLRANDNCNACELCVKICPSKSISLIEGKTHFNSKSCFLCLRCVHQCPREAIILSKLSEGKFRYRGPLGTFSAKKMLSEE